MSTGRPKFVRNTGIEEVTEQRLRQYEAMVGAPVSFPIPLEQVVERVLGLSFDWDIIE